MSQNQTQSKPASVEEPREEGLDETTCSASFEIFELRDFAFRALPKKELVRLLALVGEPPARSADRQRDLMALRLARYADRVTISVQWDSRMPNSSISPPKPNQ